MPTINGAAAGPTLLRFAPLSQPGMCLYYVWLAYKAHGATSGTTYPTALSAWWATTRRHSDKNPPAGAAVWLGRRSSDGNMAGDVCISVGGGRVACTDYPGWKQTGTCTIDQRIAQTGRAYLGWSEDFLGNTTVVIGDTTGGTTVWTAAAKQTFLVSIGLDTGGIDGDFGPKSIAATRTFQEWTGITVDGDFGPNTIAQADLVKAGGKYVPRATSEIQSFLQARGLYAGAIDNQWGPRTSVGTLRYQRSIGITADAKWGDATDARAFTTPPPPPPPPPTEPVWKNQPVDSALATWVGSPNYNYRESKPKDHITLHWMVGTLASCDAQFQNAGTIVNGRGTGSSANYGIGPDAIHQYVKESDYVQSDGNAESNASTISIEHEGGWPLPEGGRATPVKAVLDKSALLCADIARRKGWAKLEWMVNVFPHKHFVSTECPGTLDYAYIIAEANKLLAAQPPAETVAIPKALVEQIRAKVIELGTLLGQAGA